MRHPLVPRVCRPVVSKIGRAPVSPAAFSPLGSGARPPGYRPGGDPAAAVREPAGGRACCSCASVRLCGPGGGARPRQGPATLCTPTGASVCQKSAGRFHRPWPGLVGGLHHRRSAPAARPAARVPVDWAGVLLCASVLLVLGVPLPAAAQGQPTVAITWDAQAAWQEPSFTVTFTFSEDVEGFMGEDTGDLLLSPATGANFRPLPTELGP